MRSLLFPTYKLSGKNTQSENVCGIVFEKAKGFGRTIKRASVYTEGASEGFFKKGIMRKFAEFTRKHLYWNPFLVFSYEFY